MLMIFVTIYDPILYGNCSQPSKDLKAFIGFTATLIRGLEHFYAGLANTNSSDIKMKSRNSLLIKLKNLLFWVLSTPTETYKKYTENVICLKGTHYKNPF